MQQLEILLILVCFMCIALIFLCIGYWMGRKTITDTPLFEKRFNPKDNKDPELDEVMRCLQEEKQ